MVLCMLFVRLLVYEVFIFTSINKIEEVVHNGGCALLVNHYILLNILTI